jgi:acetolactate synthase-1/2/3 large subunit
MERSQAMKQNGAEVLVEVLEAQGVEHLFCSPIAVWAPLWEALARREAEGKKSPHYWNCRHEELAVGLAIGYYKRTGRPQAVLLPAGLGTLHGAMALRTAYQERIPLIVLAPDTVTYGEEPGLDPGSEWPCLLVDLGGPVRLSEGYVKWALEVKSPATLVSSVHRAYAIACSVPRGPTLLSIPFELLMGSVPWGDALPHPQIYPVVADGQTLRLAAQLLARSRSPLIVTEYGGRAPREVNTLVELAELLGAPVFESHFALYMNFPRNHLLHGGFRVEEVLGEADCILVAGSNAPWHPPVPGPSKDCRVIVLEEESLRPRSPYWGYRTDLVLSGDVGLNLAGLAQALRDELKRTPETSSAAAERALRWQARHEALWAQWKREAEGSQGTRPIHARWLCHMLNQVLPPRAVVVEELIVQRDFVLQNVLRMEPLTHFRGFMGGLGTGLTLALGVKLAAPETLVTCLIGDGSFNYNPVLAALGFAQEYGLPFLVVLFNNQGYASQKALLAKYFAEGWALRTSRLYGVDIQPTPDYSTVARAFGGYSERVTEPEEALPALRRALGEVERGRLALLDVLVAP